MVLLDVVTHGGHIKRLKAYHQTLKGFDKYLDKEAEKKSAPKTPSKKVRK